MKPIVYLFGRLSDGSYTQYPDDGTSGVLGMLYPLAKAATQVIIHRNGNFMYYCYIRKLQGNSYIGMCVLLNGTYIEESSKLFSLFENSIDELCEKGIFICYDKEGDIHPVVSHYHEESEEASFVSERIRLSFTLLLKSEKPLPPVDFSVERNSKKFFSEEDPLNDIVKSSYTFGYTCIFKQLDYDTIRMNSYRSVLNKINSEKNELKGENTALQEQNKKILNQKKQYRTVEILCILIAVCGITIISLNKKISNLQTSLSEETSRRAKVENDFSMLQTSLSEETSRREKAEIDFSKLKSSFGNYIPMIITNVEIANVYNGDSVETDYGGTIYSISSMYVKPKITYEGIKTNENITLNIKLYTPTGISQGTSSPPGCSYTESFNVYNGINTKSFQSWGGASKGFWSSGTYRYEFWYGDVCLKAKTFTIY